MSPISITEKKETDSGWMFTVETPAGTTHTVTLGSDYYTELTDDSVSPEKLVWASFSFLLRRESSAEIMQHFAISDVPTYFSDFEEQIKEEIHTIDA